MRYLSKRPRLSFSIFLGAAVLLGLMLFAQQWSPLTRVLVAWNTAAWSYLLLMWILMARTQTPRIRQIARAQDEDATKVLVILSVAAIMSLLVMVYDLATVKEVAVHVKFFHLALTGLTLMGTWLLLPTAFAVHYAHLFYTTAEGQPLPLRFPDHDLKPTYGDFLYFSLTIAVASQTADVSVGTSRTRKVVLAQSIISFFINLSLLGLSINIAAAILS